MPDWFRKSSWTDADHADFERRLSRARRSSRPQYLRIQASHLAESGHHRPALELLDRALRDHDDPVQKAQSLLQRAQSCDALELVDEALVAYRAVLVAEREFPNVRTRAAFQFPLFVARRKLRRAFTEALAVLETSKDEATFPQDRFETASARSIISAELGDPATARAQALAALAAAAESHSGFGRHPTIGLVRPDPQLVAQLRRLAG